MRFGLIGEHLTHSYSCEIHSNIANYDYELLEIKPSELKRFFEKRDFAAINVTIPYKQAVIPYLDCVSNKAKAIGAVNTVVNKDGRLYGYNTDFNGMESLLNYAKIHIKNAKVLILGTGGTAKTAYAVAKCMGAEEILFVSRSFCENAVSYEEAVTKHTNADVIINATPAGMYPACGKSAISLSRFYKLRGVADAIYNPLKTELVLEGEKLNIPSVGGLYMLSAQGVYASALFTGSSVCESDIDKAYNEVLRQKQNIVLTGMPSSGKSTVGKILAQKLNRSFADTDEIITKRVGSIAEYIRANGEKAFRSIESEVIENIYKNSGIVISTGGGAVLNSENIFRLRQNGVTVFLDRSLKNLTPSADRPLSYNINTLTDIYNKRYPVYRSTADITVNGNLSATEVAYSIIKEMNYEDICN